MENKILFDLIVEYLLFGTYEMREKIYTYINENMESISKNDLKKASLVFLKKGFFNIVSCNDYEEVIKNIDNEEFLDNYI